MNNRVEIARDFAKAIQCENIIKIILFGSVARSEDKEYSDIDILIIVNEDDPNLESIIDEKVLEFILEKKEVISPHVMTQEHFNKTKDYSFLQNVMRDGIAL